MLIYIPIHRRQFLYSVVSSRHPPNEHFTLVRSHISNTFLPWPQHARGQPGTRVQIGRLPDVELERFPLLVDLEARAAWEELASLHWKVWLDHLGFAWLFPFSAKLFHPHLHFGPGFPHPLGQLCQCCQLWVLGPSHPDDNVLVSTARTNVWLCTLSQTDSALSTQPTL